MHRACTAIKCQVPDKNSNKIAAALAADGAAWGGVLRRLPDGSDIYPDACHERRAHALDVRRHRELDARVDGAVHAAVDDGFRHCIGVVVAEGDGEDVAIDEAAAHLARHAVVVRHLHSRAQHTTAACQQVGRDIDILIPDASH